MLTLPERTPIASAPVAQTPPTRSPTSHIAPCHAPAAQCISPKNAELHNRDGDKYRNDFAQPTLAKIAHFSKKRPFFCQALAFFDDSLWFYELQQSHLPKQKANLTNPATTRLESIGY